MPLLYGETRVRKVECTPIDRTSGIAREGMGIGLWHADNGQSALLQAIREFIRNTY